MHKRGSLGNREFGAVVVVVVWVVVVGEFMVKVGGGKQLETGTHQICPYFSDLTSP